MKLRLKLKFTPKADAAALDPPALGRNSRFVSRSSAPIVVKLVRGVPHYKRSGAKGRFVKDSPLDRDVAATEQQYAAMVNKAERYGRQMQLRSKATATVQMKAEKLRISVLALAIKYQDRGRGKASIIASKLGCTDRRVRQILTENKKGNT